MLRLHAYTNDAQYRDKAEDTLEVFAGVAEQFGIYAGTYGIAATWLSRPHTQVVVVGEDEQAEALLQGGLCALCGESVGRASDRQRGGGTEPASGAGGDDTAICRR